MSSLLQRYLCGLSEIISVIKDVSFLCTVHNIISIHFMHCQGDTHSFDS